MIRFTHPELLFALILIPAFVVVFIIGRYQTHKKLREFANPEMHEHLFNDASGFRNWIKLCLLLVSLTLLIIALTGPRVGTKLKEVEKKGRELIIALDVSNSMLAQDIEPNRLSRAKQAVSRLLDGLEDDRIGLIVFAGDAYTQIPLTNDYSGAKMFLESVSTDIVSKQGTNLGAAMDLALKSFSPVMEDQEGNLSENSRALIIITDGENHESGVFESAERAREAGVVIHTIGIGDPSGVPIPLSFGSKDFKKDKEGNIIVSKLDEKTLRRIAEIGNGYYLHSGRAITGLFLLMEKLDELDKAEYKSKVFSEYDEKFQYFAGFAMFILIIEFLIMYKKNQWLQKIKIFG
jgi:Ca-activated chloride channel homolog